ncbi:MAG: DUF3179 domain-containing protein [Myxococcales bacterium]|nr:DUF3179 domain-containing protein [Myxococcales bacterium]
MRAIVFRALRSLTAASLVAGSLVLAGPASSQRTANGFVLEPASIPVAEILRGGPPRDGIPALDDPRVVAAGDAPWADDERVIGVVHGGRARAYPLGILVWHELVNDTVGDLPLLVSYCPLCGTGMVFERTIDGAVRRFGVSGLLYQSDLLMFDRGTESLWSQVEATAVTGPLRGARLTLVRSRIESWGRWRERHPQTTVLSSRTGHARDYANPPYADYATSERLIFPAPLDPRYPAKMPVVGLRVPGGESRVYPAAELARSGGTAVGVFGGGPVRVRWDAAAATFDVDAPAGVEVIEGFWFAWAAFHPETEVYVSAPGDSPTESPSLPSVR